MITPPLLLLVSHMMIMMSSSKKCGGSREVVYDDVAQCETKSYDVVQKKEDIYTNCYNDMLR